MPGQRPGLQDVRRNIEKLSQGGVEFRVLI
jgi:hypothetical protein